MPDSTLLAVQHAYPNPGYLGDSSHATIFEQITATSGDVLLDSMTTDYDLASLSPLPTNTTIGRTLLQDIRNKLSVPTCAQLVKTWICKGTNLALAGPFVEPCMEAVLEHFSRDKWSASLLSTTLTANTCTPLHTDATSTSQQYCAQLSGARTRWETLSVFLLAIVRAATDVPSATQLYTSKAERSSFRRLVLALADRCLELCLSFDCLNDLQLVVQYENWIAHSLVDGDQSIHYHSHIKLTN